VKITNWSLTGDRIQFNLCGLIDEIKSTMDDFKGH